jgi:hypothetical protein
VFAIFEAKKGALVIIDEGEDSRFEEELCTQQSREPIDGVGTALMAARCS